jgi:uncharacterized membrane protein
LSLSGRGDTKTSAPYDNPNSRLEAFCDGVFSVALTLLIVTVALPAGLSVKSTAELWHALEDLTPSLLAFLLSFAVVFITWVNHHTTLKLVKASSSPFIYANGLFLLTVVFIPFPTSLVGEYLFTDYASPAVMLYSAVCGLQAIGWFFLTTTALQSDGILLTSESAVVEMRMRRRYSCFGVAFYAFVSVIAFWLPMLAAAALGGIWFVWLAIGINYRE